MIFPSSLKFDTIAFLAHWQQFYLKVYGFNLNGGGIALPPIDQALGSGVVMDRSITIEQDLAEIKKWTKKNLLYRYTNDSIDNLIQKDKEAPRPAGPYAIWAAPAVEAIQQAPHLMKKSYDDIQESIMNFGEYTRFFLWHLWATNEPLDRQSWTLSGSFDADGSVLDGSWVDDRFHVCWYNRDHSHDYVRARQIVLPPLA